MSELRVAPWKRFLGWVSVVLSVFLGIALGFFLMGGRDATAPEITGEQTACLVVALPIFGVLFLIVGAVSWALVHLTNGLTFTFDAGPVWHGLKLRLWIFNILVQTCLIVGAGFLVATVLGPALLALGVRGSGAFVFPSMFTFIVLFAGFMPLNFWARLESRLVRRSLEAKGLAEPHEEAIVLGISDAGESALRKFFTVQDDVGVLTLEAEELSFRGEKGTLRVPRETLSVGREGDAGNSAALFGISHVVLRTPSETGERAIRLHPIGDVAMWRYRRTTDALQERLKGWISPELPGG